MAVFTTPGTVNVTVLLPPGVTLEDVTERAEFIRHKKPQGLSAYYPNLPALGAVTGFWTLLIFASFAGELPGGFNTALALACAHVVAGGLALSRLPLPRRIATTHALANLRGRRLVADTPDGAIAHAMRLAAQALTPAGQRAMHETAYRLLGSAPLRTSSATAHTLVQTITRYGQVTVPTDGLYLECADALRRDNVTFATTLIDQMRAHMHSPASRGALLEVEDKQATTALAAEALDRHRSPVQDVVRTRPAGGTA